MDYTMKSDRVVLFEKTFEFFDMREEGMEAVVPDTMPDIARIISTDGAVIIREKEVAQERVFLAAGIAVNMLYIPEDGGGIRHLDFAMQFDMSKDAPGVTSDSVPVASIRLCSIESRMLNPRKVVVRATAAVRLECWDKAAADFYLRSEECGEIKTLQRSAAISPVVCVKEKAFTVMDEYALPAAKPAVGQLLGHTTELLYEGVRAVGSKLVLKATARVTFLYLSADSGGLETLTFESPFSQLIEIERELANPECAAHMLLTAEYVEQSQTGFTAEIHVVAQLVCREGMSISYVSDCYSNLCQVEADSVATLVESVGGRRSVRETLTGELGTSMEPQRVDYCRCRMGEPVTTGGKLRLPVTAEALYTDENGQVFRAAGSMALEVPLNEADGAQLKILSAACVEPLALPGKQKVELRIPVEAELLVINELNLQQLTAVHSLEEKAAAGKCPSLTVVRASEDETLWDLGKKYGSTMELITELNSLEIDDQLSGRILLIPSER